MLLDSKPHVNVQAETSLPGMAQEERASMVRDSSLIDLRTLNPAMQCK